MTAPMKVTVIGAGIVGLATAVELLDRGDDVRVIDPDPVSGASRHAGGMLAPAAEVQYGQEPLIPLMIDSARAYPSLIERLAAHTGLPTGHHTEGTLVVAHDRADAGHLTDLLGYQHARGMAVDRLTVRQARRLEPALAPRIAGAVSIPGDHQINPRLLCTALLDALTRGSAEIIRDRAVRIEGARVHGRNGVYDADQVVLAAGLGAAQIGGWFTDTPGQPEGAPNRPDAPPLKLRPVYGDILRLGVPVHLRPMLTRVIRGFVQDRPVYLIPRTDGTLVLGATSREDDQPQPRLGGVHDLIRDAVALVPGIEETTLLEVSTGARPGTPDDVPYLGRVNDQLVVSTGYFRHGVLLAALGARDGARLVHGEAPGADLSATDPLRHV